MNYKNIYDRLMTSRSELYNVRKDEKHNKIAYYEKHHILPRCMNGSNTKDNLVLLSAREHFLAHWLLWKIYKTKQLAYAFICFSKMSSKHINREIRITSRIYDTIRTIRNKMYSGENSPKGFKGKTHSITTIQKMRDSKIGRNNPMYGIGTKHPNCKRIGELHPNYNLNPWNNANVVRKPKSVNLWNQRERIKATCKADSWYMFGKQACLVIESNGFKYTPYDFRSFFEWCNRGIV